MSRRYENYDDDERSFDEFLRWKRKQEASRGSRRYRDEEEYDDDRYYEPERVKVTTKSYALGYGDSDEEDSRPRRNFRREDRYYEDDYDDEPTENQRRSNRRSRPPVKHHQSRYRDEEEYEDEEDDYEERRPRRSEKRASRRREESPVRHSRSKHHSKSRPKKPVKKEYDEDEEEEMNEKEMRKREMREREMRAREEDDEDEEGEMERMEERHKKSARGKKKGSHKSKTKEMMEEEEPMEAKSAFVFNHAKWLDTWNKKFNSELPATKKRAKLKDLLDVINKSTQTVCETKKYHALEKTEDNRMEEKPYTLDVHDLSHSVKHTRIYTYEDLQEFMPKTKGTKKTTAHMIKSDIIDVALYVKHEIQKNPLVLVSVDSRNPGGKNHSAIFGEEVSVWRRTTLGENIDVDRRAKYFEGKDKFVYDIPANGALYVPNAYVIREGQRKGYAFKAPEQISLVCIPPILKKCEAEDKERPELTPSEIQTIKKKLANIFLIALAHNHDSIVLTAFGCGYANNRPKQIAQIFTEVIKEFRGSFSNIVFAIIDNQQSKKRNPEGNIAPFELAFKDLKPTKN